jgi:hypothetical protein
MMGPRKLPKQCILFVTSTSEIRIAEPAPICGDSPAASHRQARGLRFHDFALDTQALNPSSPRIDGLSVGTNRITDFFACIQSARLESLCDSAQVRGAVHMIGASFSKND